jgi:hypothetical protein
MAIVDTNGNSERKLRRRKFVASIKGVVVKWTPCGFFPIFGHGVGIQVRFGLDKQWRIYHGWPNSREQGENEIGEPRKSRA